MKLFSEDKRAVLYYKKLPKNISDSFVILVDPMLATAGSAIRAIEVLKVSFHFFLLTHRTTPSLLVPSDYKICKILFTLGKIIVEIIIEVRTLFWFIIFVSEYMKII